MISNDRFLANLSTQERNGVNYFKCVYNVSVQMAYKILKGEIEPPRVHETPAAVPEQAETVHETAKDVPPPADPEKPEPFEPKDCQCRYCGRRYRTRRKHTCEAYCADCVREGYHYLNMEFGSTNGWDRKPKAPKVPIKPGWRGRGVIGCNAVDFRRKY